MVGVVERAGALDADAADRLRRFCRMDGGGVRGAARCAGYRGKRAFDLVFACLGLLALSPVFVLAMLAIMYEDGRPVFFLHRRQTLGGRGFWCIKFRTMCKDAERIKALYQTSNRCDGPQFYVPSDPRVLRVGRLLRRSNIDELPQLINVLRGEMSLVGPRPSPDRENQMCPAWREARLSVLPGITGLWQVERTRLPDLDFQEWVRYDCEYAERVSWWEDIKILIKTPLVVLGMIRPRGLVRVSGVDVGDAARARSVEVVTKRGLSRRVA